MRKGMSRRSHQCLGFCIALFAVLPLAAWSKSDDLPIPILPDTEDESGVVVSSTAHSVANKVMPTSVVASSSGTLSRWAVQLGSGNPLALAAQANKLKADYPDARVVLVSGQSKLVVGNWEAPTDASAALRGLRLINAQAFVRQLPSEVIQSTATVNPVNMSPNKAVASVETVSISAVRVQTVPAAVALPKLSPKVLKPELGVTDSKTLSLSVPTDPIVDDDVLPAIVAVAKSTKPVLSAEDLALQAAADMLDGSSVMEAENTYKNYIKPAPIAPSSSDFQDLEPIKRGIELPLRAKEIVPLPLGVPLAEPLNLMLSPLYILQPYTSTKEQSPQALTMKTVLEALVKPALNERQYASGAETSQHKSDAKLKLFVRIAELANSGRWELALPLAKDAKQFDSKSLSAVDRLLLGWVWLQNKEAKIAKGYFQASLVQQPQDEARYALGLSCLLLGDKASAQTMIKEMSSGQQRDHLRSLLLR
jgi:hypothetical protein